nr:MAG TPA: hypothetical protein [Caudoviricetes sp.]
MRFPPTSLTSGGKRHKNKTLHPASQREMIRITVPFRISHTDTHTSVPCGYNVSGIYAGSISAGSRCKSSQSVSSHLLSLKNGLKNTTGLSTGGTYSL